MTEGPKLLVEWSSPWEEFWTSIGPATSRSSKKLAGEARIGLFPYRGMAFTWVLEALALAVVVVLPAKLASLRPYQPPPIPKYDVIYYSGNELPRVEDAGGAQTGKSGRAGGKQARHPTQTIRVARGGEAREKVVDAPSLKLPVSSSPVANLLAYKPVPGPPPAEGLKSSQNALQLPQMAVVAPQPEIQRQQMQRAPELAANVVPPSPTAPRRDLRMMPIPGSQAVQVVPPPVSAPENISSLKSPMTLPAPRVVAPAPAEITRDLSPRGPGFGAGELQRQVVPPPVQMSGGAMERQAVAGMGGDVKVVPPPVQVSGGASTRQGIAGFGASVAVVRPAPDMAGAGALTGTGQGNRGHGFGGLGDTGSVAAPPSGGGSGGGKGIVVSSKPGTEVGLPGGGGAGSLAISPTGGSQPGLGGSGGGSSIGTGNGSGSGFTGEGTGAAKDGPGRGAEANARGGISPFPGPGGAGNGVNGSPAMPGVSVQGGSNVITLPSFGPDGSDPSTPGRSPKNSKSGPAITIVATSRSGGAFNFYGYLKGDKVYTIYLETTVGPAVLQFADPTSAAHPYSVELAAPDPIRTELPGGILRSRLVVACILDKEGGLKNFQVLEPGNATTTAKVMAQLPKWKFRPAMRGNQPVEVNAILGFNVDTSDRY